MKRILCIWLPDWPAQRQGLEPHDENIVDDPYADHEALEELAVWCERFSPVVGIEEPDCLLLDITGLAHLFGGETAIAEKITVSLEGRGLVGRVAIADTIGAAWAVAHRDASFQLAGLETQAGSLRHEPSNIVPPGQTAAALHSLPVEALRLPEETVDLLRQLGIYDIGRLESLPREELSSRFGGQLIKRMNQAAGRADEPIQACRIPAAFQAEWSTEYPIARREMIEATLRKTIERVAQKLAACGRGALRMTCRVDCQSGEPVVVSLGLFEPNTSAEHLFELARLQFERIRFGAPITGISIEAPQTGPLNLRQQDLFSRGDDRASQRRALNVLVDRLSSRLGRQSVLRAQLQNEAQPELAFRYDPLVGAPPARRYRRRRELPPRPLCLLPRPVILSIAEHAPPTRFTFAGTRHEVANSCGPERIETGWWRGRPIWRDYYRIETIAGRRFWLFQRTHDRRWFLHGIFD